MNKLLHDIIDALPIHPDHKAKLHAQTDETVEKPETEADDGENA